MKSKGRRVERRKAEKAAIKVTAEEQRRQRDLAREIAGTKKKKS
jgi:hypothetical protein